MSLYQREDRGRQHPEPGPGVVRKRKPPCRWRRQKTDSIVTLLVA